MSQPPLLYERISAELDLAPYTSDLPPGDGGGIHLGPFNCAYSRRRVYQSGAWIPMYEWWITGPLGWGERVYYSTSPAPGSASIVVKRLAEDDWSATVTGGGAVKVYRGDLPVAIYPDRAAYVGIHSAKLEDEDGHFFSRVRDVRVATNYGEARSWPLNDVEDLHQWDINPWYIDWQYGLGSMYSLHIMSMVVLAYLAKGGDPRTDEQAMYPRVPVPRASIAFSPSPDGVGLESPQLTGEDGLLRLQYAWNDPVTIEPGYAPDADWWLANYSDPGPRRDRPWWPLMAWTDMSPIVQVAPGAISTTSYGDVRCARRPVILWYRQGGECLAVYTDPTGIMWIAWLQEGTLYVNHQVDEKPTFSEPVAVDTSGLYTAPGITGDGRVLRVTLRKKLDELPYYWESTDYGKTWTYKGLADGR